MNDEINEMIFFNLDYIISILNYSRLPKTKDSKIWNRWVKKYLDKSIF